MNSVSSKKLSIPEEEILKIIINFVIIRKRLKNKNLPYIQEIAITSKEARNTMMNVPPK